MKWVNSIQIGGIAIIILLTLTAIACGGGGDDDNGSTPTSVIETPTATAEPTPAPTQAIDTLSKAEIQTIAEGVMDAKFDDGEFNFASKEDIDTAVSEVKAKLDELGDSLLDEDALRLIVTEIVNEKLTQLLVDKDESPDTTSGAQASTDGNNTHQSVNNQFVMPEYKGFHRQPEADFGVICETTFIPETNWILCEPGVLLDNTAAFTKANFNPPGFANAPEGGFTYFSMGEGVLEFEDGTIIVLESLPATNYLVIIRGPLSDGKRDVDLNQTITISEFSRAHAIWSEIPPNHPDGSAYVSQGWFGQQMVVSFTTGGTNCGSDGCSNVRVVLYDMDSRAYQEHNVTDIVSGNVDDHPFPVYIDGDWELVRDNTN